MSVAFTLDTYAHVTPPMWDDAVEVLNDILPKGIVADNGTKMAQSDD